MRFTFQQFTSLSDSVQWEYSTSKIVNRFKKVEEAKKECFSLHACVLEDTYERGHRASASGGQSGGHPRAAALLPLTPRPFVLAGAMKRISSFAPCHATLSPPPPPSIQYLLVCSLRMLSLGFCMTGDAYSLSQHMMYCQSCFPFGMCDSEKRRLLRNAAKENFPAYLATFLGDAISRRRPLYFATFLHYP